MRHDSRRSTPFAMGLLFVAAFGVLAALASWSRADEIVLKSGGRLQGTIVSETESYVEIDTRFGRQKLERANIARIERKATPAERIAAARAKLAPHDVAGRFALWQQCADAALRAERAALQEEILELAPQHPGLHEALGHVLWEGRYVTPDERAVLEVKAREEQMRAQGLVPYKGRFVTPEEKEKLDQGLVLKDDRWIPEEEAKRMEGLVRGENGDWIPYADGCTADTLRTLRDTFKRTFLVASRDHVAVYTDVSQAFADTTAVMMEKGFRAFAREFGVDPGLAWFGERRADFVVFRIRPDYEQFTDWVAIDRKLGATWSTQSKQVAGVYLFDTWPLAATYVANRGESMATAHCANMLGHVLLNRYRCEGKLLPPFFDEAFAALTEFELTGRNAFFSLGSGRYAKTIRDDERAFFEDGRWIEPLRDAFRTKSDTPMDQVVRRDHASLTQMDVAKGMALYQYWRKQDAKLLPTFFDRLRDAWPAGNPNPAHPTVLFAVSRAFADAIGADLAGYDAVLRQFAMRAGDGDGG